MLRSAAEAIGDSSQADGSKDAAIATSLVTSTSSAQPVRRTAAHRDRCPDGVGRQHRHVTTRGDAGGATAGAGIALAIVTFETDAFIATTGDVSAASLLVSADSTDTVTTLASASQGGATANDETPSDRTEGNAQTSDEELSVAGALAFTKLDSHTTAYVGGTGPVSVTTTGQQRISAESGHTSTATADGSAASGSPGVGIAIAIALSDVSAEAFVSGAAELTATSLTIEAVNESGATYEVTATAGVSPSTGTVITGAFALHVLTSLTRAVLPAGSTVTVGGADVVLTSTSESASTVKSLPSGTSTTGDLGIGAAFALNIVDDKTTAGLEDTSVLTGADALTHHRDQHRRDGHRGPGGRLGRHRHRSRDRDLNLQRRHGRDDR